MNIRSMQFNNLFYVGEANNLREDINTYFQNIPRESGIDPADIKATIVPHAGYKYSARISSHFYKLIQGDLNGQYIILGFNHKHRHEGLTAGSWLFWDTPFGQISVENKMLDGVGLIKDDNLFNDEHSIEVQLPLLKYSVSDAQILPVLVGRLELVEDWAEKLIKYMDEKATLIISSDLSHYLNSELAQAKDERTIQKILNLDPTVKHEEACGADAINLLLYIARLKGWQAKLLKYANSGDTYGDKKSVVGYTAIIFI